MIFIRTRKGRKKRKTERERETNVPKQEIAITKRSTNEKNVAVSLLETATIVDQQLLLINSQKDSKKKKQKIQSTS